MEKQISVSDARKDFGNLVETVQYQGSFYVIERRGMPAAAVVPIRVYENWKKRRKEFFDSIRTIQESVSLDPDEAERIAVDAVTNVRELEKKQQKKKNGI